jgi:hypothetical protein
MHNILEAGGKGALLECACCGKIANEELTDGF